MCYICQGRYYVACHDVWMHDWILVSKPLGSFLIYWSFFGTVRRKWSNDCSLCILPRYFIISQYHNILLFNSLKSFWISHWFWPWNGPIDSIAVVRFASAASAGRGRLPITFLTLRHVFHVSHVHTRTAKRKVTLQWEYPKPETSLEHLAASGNSAFYNAELQDRETRW